MALHRRYGRYGWGSGTAEFPYLISPSRAIKTRAAADGTTFINTVSNWDLETAKAVASNASIAVVFVTAHAGENFVSVGGNAGDRNSLTLWDNGDALIKAVASVNPNTVVVMHTAGPVILGYAKAHPSRRLTKASSSTTATSTRPVSHPHSSLASA